MANCGRLLAALTATVAAVMLSGCGNDGSTVTQSSATASQVDNPTKQTKALPGEQNLEGPTANDSPPTADREVTGELTGFISPSGNVACMIDPSFVRCDIIDHDWSPPPRPADCEFDYGQGITLSPGGPAEFVCAGDTAFGPDEVLPYGSTIVAGVLQCDSAESGFTCRDVETGQGFSISRQAYQLF